ncbi:MAG TPA: AI-2E family transporter, partial [Planctomycetota bacterium]|nr:AI-2E family transporter [Planctomycetota bacterium]
MVDVSARNKRNLGLFLVAVVSLWFAWTVRAVLNPLLLAYGMAFLAHPFVLRLEARGWSRKGAVNTIYVAAGVAGLLLFMGFWSQGSSLFQRFLRQAQGQDQEGGLFTSLDERFAGFAHEHQDAPWLAWLQPAETNPPAVAPDGGPVAAKPEDAGTSESASEPAGNAEDATQEADRMGVADEPIHLIPALQRLWNQVILEMDPALAGSAARRGVGVVGSWFGSFLGLVSMLVLLPIYTWFLLFQLEDIQRFVRRHLPVGERARITAVGSQVGTVLTGFLRGQLLVCLLKGLVITVGLWIAGIPYALFLGLTAGFAALIPFFGASLAAVFT